MAQVVELQPHLVRQVRLFELAQLLVAPVAVLPTRHGMPRRVLSSVASNWVLRSGDYRVRSLGRSIRNRGRLHSVRPTIASTVMLLSSAGGVLALVMLMQTGADPALLFAWLFLVHFFNNAAITLTVGPLCAETVPATLMATASGVVIAVGELFGGGLAPVIAGHVATAFGIDKLLLLPILTLSLAFLLSMFLVETRPRASLDTA